MREFLINTKPLNDAIKSLMPFISTEEIRYYLNGIFFEWQNGESTINMVATDGHKLCVLKVEINPVDDTEGDIAAIVPTAALKTILQMLKQSNNAEFPILIQFNDGNSLMKIDCADQKAEFKCIDGTFPDYRRVIPTEAPKFTIGLMRDQATEAVKAVAKHKSTDPMEWHLTDATSPIKLVGENKIVVIMPCRAAVTEMNLGNAA